MDYFSSTFKLGILGGGQLGKMLLSETRKFDIRVKKHTFDKKSLSKNVLIKQLRTKR